MYIIMIAVHKNTKNSLIGFRFLDSDSGQIMDVNKSNAIQVLSSNRAQIENLEIVDGQLKGSNGALTRFPTLINNQLQGKSPLIVISELSNNRYKVCNYTGEIVDMTEENVVRYSASEGIANGKVVGNHISSICGEYRKDKSVLDKDYGEKLKAKMSLVGTTDYSIGADCKAKCMNKDIEVLKLGTGILGIEAQGFKGCTKLTQIGLPSTLEVIGDGAFMGCKSLKSIVIPEGVEVIPSKCFSHCTSLVQVSLPNSIKRIEREAFSMCSKLKVIECGPMKIDIAFGAIPRGVARKIRKVEY